MLNDTVSIIVPIYNKVKVSGKMSADRKADRLEKFHRLLCDGYTHVMSGDRPVLFKMKELWGFLIHSCPEEEKLMKKIRKAQRPCRI